MENKLLIKEEVVKIGYDYSELEMNPPYDILFFSDGDLPDSGVPVTGVVYDFDDEETLPYYGEYEPGLPHGISVDFDHTGRLKRDATYSTRQAMGGSTMGC